MNRLSLSLSFFPLSLLSLFSLSLSLSQLFSFLLSILFQDEPCHLRANKNIRQERARTTHSLSLSLSPPLSLFHSSSLTYTHTHTHIIYLSNQQLLVFFSFSSRERYLVRLFFSLFWREFEPTASEGRNLFFTFFFFLSLCNI
jgi:hypothetical protein